MIFVKRPHSRYLLNRRNRSLLIADWTNVVFVHFAIEREFLQPVVPFELDLLDGQAMVSLVAFTQRHLRPMFGGKLARVLSAPLSDHEFLNVRTYVRHRDQKGIFFIAEWIPNRLAAFLGPRMYGLPYRLGQLTYRCDAASNQFAADIDAGGDHLAFRAISDSGFEPAPAMAGSESKFLLERYIAFTARAGIYRRFAVHHAPWLQQPVRVEIQQTALLQRTCSWFAHACLHGAHASPGVADVIISRPDRITV
jgi:uncharacterized protein